MMKHLLILIALVGLLSSPAFGQNASGTLPTPNAAVGYLMALGWMPPTSDKVMAEFSELETVAALEKLSPDARKYLADGKMNIVVMMLNQGAACELCRFGYEHTYRPEEPVPPFKRLRELSRLARAYGLNQLKKGKAADAFTTFRSIFRMGGHLENDGTLIAGMVGLAMKKIATTGFEELLNQGKDEKVIASVRAFLQSLPSATLAAAPALESEKKFLANCLKMISDSPATDADLRKDWETLKFLLPSKPGASDSTSVSPPIPALKACQANQRVLAGAIEMFCMDYNPMPATITTALIPELLVSSKYLKTFPVCQDGGKYELSQIKEGSYEWKCTVHPGPDATSEAPPANTGPTDAEIQEFKTFVTGPEFAKVSAEALAIYDEAMAFQPYAPEFKAKIDAFQKKVETSPNSLIRASMPNIKKVFEKQIELDEAIKKLITKN